MGFNMGSSASNGADFVFKGTDPTVFRIRVVEHISWDSYDEEKKCFLAGHENNKPIVGREFKIKMPDGSIVTKTTDEDGVIELTGREPNDKFDVIFEPESAAMNNKYQLLYNRITVVDPHPKK